MIIAPISRPAAIARRPGPPKGAKPAPKWTEAELAYLKAERSKIPPVPIKTIADALGRQTPATYNRARMLGLIVQAHRPYTAKDRATLARLAAIYPPLTDGQIADQMGRAAESLRWLMGEMGLIALRKELHARHAAERLAERAAKLAAERASRPPRVRVARAPRLPRDPRPRLRPDTSVRAAEKLAAREQSAAVRAHIVAEAHARADVTRALRVMAVEELAHIEMLAKARAAHARAEAAALERDRREAKRVADRAAAKATRATAVAARRAAIDAARLAKAAEREAKRLEAVREKALRRAALAAAAATARAARAAVKPIVVQLTPVAASAPKPTPPKRSFATMPGPAKLASRDQALALSNAAADAVAAFIAAKGVTRIAADPREAAIARLRQLGYEVLAHGKGVILDRKTVLRTDAAIFAYLAERHRSHAA